MRMIDESSSRRLPLPVGLKRDIARLAYAQVQAMFAEHRIKLEAEARRLLGEGCDEGQVIEALAQGLRLGD